MTKSDLAIRTSVISRIAAEYTHELIYAWSHLPDEVVARADCAALASRFVEEIDTHLSELREQLAKPVPATV